MLLTKVSACIRMQISFLQEVLLSMAPAAEIEKHFVGYLILIIHSFMLAKKATGM